MPPTRRAARKIEPPTPRRLATKLQPSGDGFERVRPEDSGDPDLQTRVRTTRDIGLRSSTGRAESRGLTDPRDVEFIPMGSSVSANPRVREAGYDAENQTVLVTFRDGTPWAYYNVPPEVWHEFRTSDSPGRYINRVLNGYPYGKDITRGTKQF